MANNFILWAQALDNTSPDLFYVHGKYLEPDDTVQRQVAVSKVSSVIKHGVCIFEQYGVLLTANASHFVVEVPSTQRDIEGRAAPIVCYGVNSVTDENALGDSAAAALDDFAKRIGRTLPPEHFELVHLSFEALKKKFATTRLARIVGVCGVILALLVIVYWLEQRAW